MFPCAAPVFDPVCVQLTDTEEYVDGELSGKLGEVLIRCNNVMYMRAATPST